MFNSGVVIEGDDIRGVPPSEETMVCSSGADIALYYPLVNQQHATENPHLNRSTINGPFSIAILAYQRVNQQIIPLNPINPH